MSKKTLSNIQDKKIIDLDNKIVVEEQKIKELKEHIETDSKNLKEQKNPGLVGRFLRAKAPNETAIKILETRIKKNQEDVLKSEKELKSLTEKEKHQQAQKQQSHNNLSNQLIRHHHILSH